LCCQLVRTLRWAGSPLLLLVRLTRQVGWARRTVHHPILQWELLDEVATAFLFLLCLGARILSSTMRALLTKSRKVPPMLSARHSYSLVESLFMKQSIFFSSM
jgi:hypothetical protein